MAEDELRAAAIRQLKKKADFRRVAGVFVGVWLLLTAIWALSGMGYFWPIWAILGMAIALFFVGLDAYGRPKSAVPTETEIEREMRRLGGEDQRD